MLRLPDGRLYTGITTDVHRRLAEHQAGRTKGARSLRGKGTLELAYVSPVAESRAEALLAERAVKKLKKHRKEAIVAGSLQLAAVLPGFQSA
jgi:putative endonuclease